MPGRYTSVFVVPHDLVFESYGQPGYRLFVSAPPFTFESMLVYETLPPFFPADRARYVGVAGDIYDESERVYYLRWLSYSRGGRGDDNFNGMIPNRLIQMFIFFEKLNGELVCYYHSNLSPSGTFIRYRVEGPRELSLWHFTIRLYDGIITLASLSPSL